MKAPRPTHPAALGALIVLLVLATSAPSQEGESIREAQVREILSACKGAGISAIWERSDQLVALGNPAKRILRNSLKDTGIEGRLAALRALIELDSPTFAADKLAEIAADEALEIDHRILAIELIGQTEEIDAEDGLLELLVSYNPRLRIAAARALWRLDSGRKDRAKAVLVEFLGSTDADLRAQGALTLAEMGDIQTPGVREILLDLRKEPGARGQLASALYQKLQLQRVIQFYEARQDEAGASNRKRSPWRHLDEIRQLLRQLYDLQDEVDDTRLRVDAARGMLELPNDPHTLFLSPDQYQEFLHGNLGVDPSYGGIGAFIDTNVANRFRILRPIFGGPAWKADIRGGDDIVAVNGDPTAGRTNEDIIKQVKGPPGTPVILTIVREGWAEPRDISVIRAKIVLPTVFSRMLPGKIGYIAIAQFAFETGKELRKQLVAMEQEGMTGLVLDLRDNPGGLLDSVKACLTLFLGERDFICSVKGRAYKGEKHYAGRPDRERRYPVSVLVNGRSASGAELMSGVLQHYSTSSELAEAETPYVDARVLGEATFGKGTVQNTIPLRSWPGEPFQDEPRRNGRWDYGEKLETDKNGNGRWDPGDTFLDLPLRNRRWDDAEPWEDQNGNGRWDEGESFTDENNDGIWNAGEKFDDLNRNGQYDNGAAVKLTVARYYLPSGRNFTRTREFENGAYVYKGGVVPDIEVENPRLRTAHLVELRELQEDGVFSDYVKSRWNEHRETFRKLAWFDGRDPARYPDFDAFYEVLKTRLSLQEVRRAVRIEVRREVANEIGKEILGDLSDDEVLRRGVHEILKRLGVDADAIEEYRALNGETEVR